MKKIFCFDTETTGVEPTDRIVQFSGIFGSVVEGKFYKERIIDQYIDPAIPISEGASKVHGITNDMVVGFGKIESYIKEFVAYYVKADIIVGHNIDFDIRMLKQELNRLKLNYNLNKNKYDTMKEGTEICKIENGKGGYKRPKLTELYKHFFKKDFENAHNSLADVEATLDCYLKMSDILYDDPF